MHEDDNTPLTWDEAADLWTGWGGLLFDRKLYTGDDLFVGGQLGDGTWMVWRSYYSDADRPESMSALELRALAEAWGMR